MVHDHHADASSAVAALIMLILLMVQQSFLISSPIYLPMVNATLIAMVIAVNSATMIVVIIPVVITNTTKVNSNITSS
jgi:hypothetical protein